MDKSRFVHLKLGSLESLNQIKDYLSGLALWF